MSTRPGTPSPPEEASGALSAPAHRTRPRPRWLLVVVVFLMFCSVLLTNGLVTSEIGIDANGASADGPDNAVPVAVSEGGSVIDLTHDQPRTYAMPPKTVALSFDDGPDVQ